MHRDLKPENVLLTSSGIVKIIDFGIARNIDHSYRLNESYQMTPDVTTPLYKAPECFFGKKFYDQKVDIWACGCIFYELLTSERMLPTNQNEEGVVLG